MLSPNEKDEVLGIKVTIPSNEEILAKRLAIAIEALEKIDQECLRHDTTAWSIASNALEEIKEVK